MAGIQQIMQKEGFENKEIHLYREGMFLKGYEQSAFLFLKHIKPEYQVKAKYFKVINQWVVSIGFPEHALSNLVNDKQVVTNDNGVDIPVIRQAHSPVDELAESPVIDEKDYNQWKEEHIRLQEEKVLVRHCEGEARSNLPLPQPLPKREGSGSPPVGELEGVTLSCNESDNRMRIIHQIQTFDLANKTPMQCALFLSDLSIHTFIFTEKMKRSYKYTIG